MSNPNETGGTETGLAAQVRRGRPPRVREESHEPVREPQGRSARVPLGVRKQKLIAEPRPGYVPRWINDDGDRIQQAIQGGWDFVLKDKEATSDDLGNRISRIVGSKSSGGALTAYLMEIREDWFRADQIAKQEKINATESLIKRGELGQKPGVDGAYNKHIKITQG